MFHLLTHCLNDSCAFYIDIDECETLSSQCNQTCTNIPGSFGCSCNVGYVLDSDGRSCNGTKMFHWGDINNHNYTYACTYNS